MATNALGFTPLQELLRQQDNRTPEVRAVLVVMLPLTIVAVALRFLSRRLSKSRFWWDDWLVLVSLVFSVGLVALFLFGCDYGLGKHAEFLSVAQITVSIKITYAAEVIYATSMSCVKIGILLFYYRIFRVNQPFKIAVWVLGTVTVCWYITTVFVACFQCYPANFLWDRTIPGGQCIPMSALYYGSSVSSLLTDIAVFCLPMPIIWNMSVCRNQKIALSAIFLLGAFVCVTSIVRLATIHELTTLDGTYTNVPSAIWTSVECCAAVISACLPTYTPLCRSFFDLPTHLSPESPFHKVPRDSQSGDGPSAQWRHAANEKRILDLTEFRHYDEEISPRWPTTRHNEEHYSHNKSRSGSKSTNWALSMDKVHLCGWEA